MKVSYGITVCNENYELHRLLNLLLPNTSVVGDEVVVLVDKNNTTQDVLDTLNYSKKLYDHDHFKWFYGELNNDFSQFKNDLNSKCSGEYIFQIDADEIPSDGLIGSNLHNLLNENDLVELFLIPRINTIAYDDEDSFKEYCNSQGWFLNNDNDQGEYWINFPDNQARIYKNLDRIEWLGKVHERIVGAKSFSILHSDLDLDVVKKYYHLKHHKTLEKQKCQNELYSDIISK